MPILLGIGFFLFLAGCANQRGGEDIVHGSVGVQMQSRDTSRFDGHRTPF